MADGCDAEGPGDGTVLRCEEWGACQRVHCGASVGRGTGSQPGLGPGGPGTLCPLRSPGRAYSNCPTSGTGRAWASRQGRVSGKQAWIWEDWREPSDELTAGWPLPLSPQLLVLLWEKQESVLLSGEGAWRVGASLQPAPWLHTPGAGHAGSRLLGGLGLLPCRSVCPACLSCHFPRDWPRCSGKGHILEELKAPEGRMA